MNDTEQILTKLDIDEMTDRYSGIHCHVGLFDLTLDASGKTLWFIELNALNM